MSAAKPEEMLLAKPASAACARDVSASPLAAQVDSADCARDTSVLRLVVSSDSAACARATSPCKPDVKLASTPSLRVIGA